MAKFFKKASLDKTKFLLGLMLVITVSAVCVTVWALFFHNEEAPVLVPDVAPVETENYAQPIPNDTSEKAQSEQGGGRVTLTYSNRVTISLSEEQAKLMFANPRKSNQDMIIQIVIQDLVVAQSGKLTAGNQIEQLDLIEGTANRISAGIYDGYFFVFYYSQETGEKATVNTKIPIQITVDK